SEAVLADGIPLHGRTGAASAGPGGPGPRGSLGTRRMRVLHVEVGGSYGGSLRALEVYLAHSRDFEHDVPLYYPTAGAERRDGRASPWCPTPATPSAADRTDAR